MCVPTDHRGHGVLGHWPQSWLLVLEPHHLSYRDGAGGGRLSRDWERKDGSSAGRSHIPTQKSGNLWSDQCLEQEASGKAKEESAPGKDDRAGVMENSREHKESEMSYVS